MSTTHIGVYMHWHSGKFGEKKVDTLQLILIEPHDRSLYIYKNNRSIYPIFTNNNFGIYSIFMVH